MEFKDVLSNYKYYIILAYVLTIIGIIISYYFHNYLDSFVLHILLVVFSFSCIALDLFANYFWCIDKKTNNEYFKIFLPKLGIKYKKLLIKGFINSLIHFKHVIGTISLIIIPIIVGSYYFMTNFSTESYSYIKLITISFEMTLVYVNLVRGQLFQKDNRIFSLRVIVGMVFLIILLSTPQGWDVLNYILDYIFEHVFDAFSVLIALIMLCVGLSALSFGYCSILDGGSNMRKIMKKNGEGYFISSILTIISIILLFILSLMKNHMILMSLPNLNIFCYDFLLLNIFSAMLIIILSFTAYATYYMIQCSISILQELKFFGDFE